MLLSAIANIPDLATASEKIPDLASASGQVSRALQLVLQMLQSAGASSDFINNYLQKLHSSYSITLTILSLIIALMGCFFGYKLSRIFMALTGFIAGVVLGIFITVKFLEASNGIVLLGALLGGILLSLFAFKIYQAGIFVLCFFLSFVATAELLPFDGKIGFFLCTVAGFIVGTLALKYVRSAIIVTTALVSANMGAQAIMTIGPMTGSTFQTFFQLPFAEWIAFAVLLLLGCLVQFLTSREESNKNRKNRNRKNKRN